MLINAGKKEASQNHASNSFGEGTVIRNKVSLKEDSMPEDGLDLCV